jgi:histone H3/H4
MSKHISQDTFDDVVRENIEEFEMSAQEALAEAVQQFEAQVSLVNKEMNDLYLILERKFKLKVIFKW